MWSGYRVGLRARAEAETRGVGALGKAPTPQEKRDTTVSSVG